MGEIFINYLIFNIIVKLLNKKYKYFMGIGDWGLGIGVW